jgi:3-dehydroquinate synthase
VKYALLAGGELLDRLEADAGALVARDQLVLGEVVRACVAYKAGVVEVDELDQGVRAVLNLGHTVAHALEVVRGYGSLAHGVAVGLGTLAALAVSEQVLGLDPAVRRRTEELMLRLGLPTTTAVPAAGEMLRAAGLDKKVSGSGRGFVCLRAIGEPLWGVDVSDDVLVRALEVISA